MITQDDQLLLCRISNELPRWAGYWTLPGGGINFGENPEEAMIREVEEEAGLLVKALSLNHIDSLVDCSGETDFHAIRIIYNVECFSGILRDEKTGTTDQASWFTKEEIAQLKLVDLAEVGVGLVYKNAS